MLLQNKYTHLLNRVVILIAGQYDGICIAQYRFL